MNTIRVVKSLDLQVLILVQSVCKLHQQSTKMPIADQELNVIVPLYTFIGLFLHVFLYDFIL